MKKLASIVLTALIILVFSNNCYCEESQDYTYYYNLGYAKLVDGSFDMAIKIFQQTLELKPDCAEALLGLGIAYRQTHELNKALEATKKALKYDPNYFKAYYNLGLILEELNDKKGALEAYKTFYKKVPEAKNIPDLKEKINSLKQEL